MELSYVYTTIILGIAVSLIFTEITGISAEFGLSRFMMLYGKRKFAAFVFVALILRIALNLALGGIFDSLDALTSVGVVTAALIASTISKQGVGYTLLGTGVVTLIVYGAVELIAQI